MTRNSFIALDIWHRFSGLGLRACTCIKEIGWGMHWASVAPLSYVARFGSESSPETSHPRNKADQLLAKMGGFGIGKGNARAARRGKGGRMGPGEADAPPAGAPPAAPPAAPNRGGRPRGRGAGRGRRGGAVPPAPGAPPAGGRGDGEGRGYREQPYGDWCGTLNNPTVPELFSLWMFNQPHGPVPPEHELQYISIGWEHWMPGAGTPHLQLYLELRDGPGGRVRRTTMSRWFPRVHWERRRRTRRQAREYTQKDGVFRERGEPKQDKADLNAAASEQFWGDIIARIQDHLTWEEVVVDPQLARVVSGRMGWAFQVPNQLRKHKQKRLQN